MYGTPNRAPTLPRVQKERKIGKAGGAYSPAGAGGQCGKFRVLLGKILSLAGALHPPFPFEFSNGRVTYSWIPLFAWKKKPLPKCLPPTHIRSFSLPLPQGSQNKRLQNFSKSKGRPRVAEKRKKEHSSPSPMEKQHHFLEWISDSATKLTHSHTYIRGARPLTLLVQKKNALE